MTLITTLDGSVSADLEALVLRQFDLLKERGLLFYEDPNVEYVTDDGFKFEFRSSPVLKAKPILAANDPGRTQAGGPFSNPEPEFVVATIGSSHLLQLSKYCMLRPLLILHPIHFALQTLDLDMGDVAAAWKIMHALDTSHIVLYNCGAEAGASQGHKHLQIFPEPGPEFDLFPDMASLNEDEVKCLSSIPYIHWLVKIPADASVQIVYALYQRSLAKTKESMYEGAYGRAHNVLFTKRWLITIPRRTKGRDGIGANGAGMLGLCWLRGSEERRGWDTLGLTKHLQTLGLPNTARVRREESHSSQDTL